MIYLYNDTEVSATLCLTCPKNIEDTHPFDLSGSYFGQRRFAIVNRCGFVCELVEVFSSVHVRVCMSIRLHGCEWLCFNAHALMGLLGTVCMCAHRLKEGVSCR